MVIVVLFFINVPHVTAASSTVLTVNSVLFDVPPPVPVDSVVNTSPEQVFETGLTVKHVGRYSSPKSDQLVRFSTCGYPDNVKQVSRPEVVDAFEKLCVAALQDDVHLEIIYGFRTYSHQRRLWDSRVAREQASGKTFEEAVVAAGKWVARPGTSKHNFGVAIDVNTLDDVRIRDWIHDPVGCYNPYKSTLRLGTTMLDPIRCVRGESVVKRVQLYGFFLPLAHEPWHLEYGSPVQGLSVEIGYCFNSDVNVLPVLDGTEIVCIMKEPGFTTPSSN